MSDNVIRKKFVIGEEEYDKDLEQELFVNRGDLSGEFADHSLRFAWFSTAYELCVDHEARVKSLLERQAAHLDFIVRQEFQAANLKSTEKKVENSVITRPEYTELQEKLFDAKLQTGLAKAARDAMIHRRDMLIGLGANQRAEGNSDVSILTEQVKNKLKFGEIT